MLLTVIKKRKSYNHEKKVQGKERPNTGKCFVCDKSGHYAKDCPHKPDLKRNRNNYNERDNSRDNYTSNKRPRGFDGFIQDNESVNMVKTAGNKPGSKKKGALDSGATSHMLTTESVSQFTRSQSRVKATNFRQTAIPVATAKSGSHINAIGRVDLGNVRDAIVVEDGDLEKPLLSISKLDRDGYETTFKNGTGTIRDPEGKVVLEAPLEDDLYQFDMN